MINRRRLVRPGARPGYTLLELLISVLIFSGIIILALAAFARSASSSSKTNTIRAQVQASQTLMNQLTNDLHYVDTTDSVTSLYTTCGTSAGTFTGVRLGNNCDEIELLLKYPGATGSGDLVWRLYAAQTINNRPSVYLYELRGCSVASGAISCPGGVSAPADLLSTNYVTDGEGLSSPVFSGQDIATAQTQNVTAHIKISFTLKSSGSANQTCSQLLPGSCYTISTTVVPNDY